MPVPRILFVCVENSCRSQMAEAFARMIGGDRVNAASAGSKASGRVDERALASMRELGYDMGAQRSTRVDEVSGEFDAVVSMGCGEQCPFVPAALHEDWGIPDPKLLEARAFARVRDGIHDKVEDLLERLGVEV